MLGLLPLVSSRAGSGSRVDKDEGDGDDGNGDGGADGSGGRIGRADAEDDDGVILEGRAIAVAGVGRMRFIPSWKVGGVCDFVWVLVVGEDAERSLLSLPSMLS